MYYGIIDNLAGKNRGIVLGSWLEVKGYLKVNPHCQYKKFKTEQEARDFSNGIIKANGYLKASSIIDNSKLNKSDVIVDIRELYFDAGKYVINKDMKLDPKKNKFGINITGMSGKALLPSILHRQFGPGRCNKDGHLAVSQLIENGNKETNNVGELLAMYYALYIAIMSKGIVSTICGDSNLVINYWSKGYAKDTLPSMVKSLAAETAILREIFEAMGGVIRAVPGSMNRADLGHHRRTKRDEKNEEHYKSMMGGTI